MKLDKIKLIQLLEKYKKVSQTLGLTEDEALIEELAEIVTEYAGTAGKTRDTKKNKLGEADFQQLISTGQTDLSTYELNSNILSNKENMADFWSSLAEEDKSKFTIFELNVILYLISAQFNKYQKKDKQKIIRFVDHVVRDIKMEDSYKTLKV